MADDDNEKDEGGNPEKRIGEEKLEAGDLKYTPPETEEEETEEDDDSDNQ